jgi:ferredoxin
MIHKFTYSQNCLFEFFKTLTTKMLVFLNPELENFMSYQITEQCIGCDRCISICPTGAIKKVAS